jgi:RHS repeat-associated protein
VAWNTYNKRNNQLNTTDEPDTFSYDDNGNLTTHKLYPGPRDWALTYDFENRMTRLEKKATGLPTIYDTLWFTYCGMGKRIKKIEKPNGQNPDTTAYAYDGMYATCEFGGHLDLEYKYIYANGMLLARYNESSADTHYYHHDGLGSIMGMTAENASVEKSYFYDEFGNSLGSWGSVSNHYLYTGQELDGSITNLYNLRARYYDKSTGRFISEDKMSPLKIFPQTSNNYVYTLNSPINFIDPLGLWCIWVGRVTKELGKVLIGSYEGEKTPWKWTGMSPLYRECYYVRYVRIYDSGWIRFLRIDFYLCFEKRRFYSKTVFTGFEEPYFEFRRSKPEPLTVPTFTIPSGEQGCPPSDDPSLPK